MHTLVILQCRILHVEALLVKDTVLSAMDVRGPWPLDPTECMSAFVLALGVLWIYVMLVRPS